MKKCPFCAEAIQDAAIKCRFCGSALAGREGRRSASPKPQVHLLWILAIAAGILFAARYVTIARTGAGYLLIVGAIAVVALPVVLTRRSSSQGPRSLEFFSRWRFIGAITLVIAGAVLGLSERGDRQDRCKKHLSSAVALHAEGGATPAAFEQAVDACEQADMTDERDEALVVLRVLNKKVAAEQAAARANKFELELLEAKRIAATPGNEQKAVAAYRRAAALGTLRSDHAHHMAMLLITSARQLLDEKNHNGAIAAIAEAKRRNPNVEGTEQLLAAATSAKRAADIAAAVKQAEQVARTKCDDWKAVKGAWLNIREVDKLDPSYAPAVRAVAKLDQCRKTNYTFTLLSMQALRTVQRKSRSQQLENAFQDQGVSNVRVRLEGKDLDRLTVVHGDLTRAIASSVTKKGSKPAERLLAELELEGFKRLTFSNGKGGVYPYTLHPTSEAQLLADGELTTPLRVVQPVVVDDETTAKLILLRKLDKAARVPAYRVPLGDPKARYFVLEKAGDARNRTLLTRREGPSGVSYARRLLDCVARSAKYLGDGDTLEEFVRSKPNPEMGPLVEGSSTHAAWEFACKK